MNNSLGQGLKDLEVEQTQQAAKNPTAKETSGEGFDIWSDYGVNTGVRRALPESLLKYNEYCLATVKDTAFKIEMLNDSDKAQAPIQLVIADKGTETLVYAQLLEKGLFEEIRPSQRNVRGVSVSYNPTASGLITAQLRSTIKRELVERGYKNINVIHCAIVPESADLELQKVADYHMTFAILALRSGNQEIKASHLKAAKNGKVVASYDFKPGSTRINALGRPLATDFTITTELRSIVKSESGLGQQQNAHQRKAIRLANVGGFVDAIYRNDSATGMGANAPIFAGQQKASPSYIAVVVANEINGISGSLKSQENIMTQVFGVTSLANLASNKKWSRAFVKVPGSATQKTNIGVLGLECNIFNDPSYKPEELKVVNYGMGSNDEISLAAVVNNYFHPLCLVALDIERGGVSEFTQRHFEKAAGGNAESIELINSTINTFTDGAFSKYWDLNKSPVNAGCSIMHTAFYYDDKTSEIKDRDSIDYFASLDVFQGNELAMNDLTVSPERNGFISLTKRLETINNIAPLTQTGWKVRVFFKNDWINAVVAALKETELSIVPENLDSPQDTSRSTDSVLGLDVSGTIDTTDLFSGSLRENSAMDDDLFGPGLL